MENGANFSRQFTNGYFERGKSLKGLGQHAVTLSEAISNRSTQSTIERTGNMDENSMQSPASSDHLAIPGVKMADCKFQFLAAFAACAGPVSLGCVAGFTSPAMEGLIKDFDLTEEEQSLVGSLATIGALFGGLVAGFTADYFGRKMALMMLSLPFVAGWLLIISAQNVLMLYLGRVVTGICIGMTSMCAPVYVSEISSPEVRGILGSSFQLFINLGILLVYTMGSFLHWDYLALVSTVVAALMCILMIPMPESPCWLMSNGKPEKAREALIWLRGPKADIVLELARIQADQEAETKMAFKDFLKPSLIRPLVLMLVEMAVQQLSGINAILFNTVAIFKSSSPSMDPHLSAVIVGICLVLATACTMFLMDQLGRRLLLLGSSIFMAASMVSLGLFDYLKHGDSESIQHITWLPVLSLVVFVVSFMMGFGPIPWIMMSEVFPRQARGLASSIITGANWGMAFLVTKSFSDLQNAMHDYGVFWLFASVAAFGTVYVYFQVPETKGKTLEEIEEYFSARDPILINHVK